MVCYAGAEVIKEKLMKLMYSWIKHSGAFTKKVQRECKKLEKWQKILNVENLFRYELGVFMFKFVHRFIPVNFKCYFKSITKIHFLLTRSSKTIFFPKI